MAKTFRTDKQYAAGHNHGIILDIARACASAGGSIAEYSDGSAVHAGAPADETVWSAAGAWLHWITASGHHWAAQKYTGGSNDTLYRVTMSIAGFSGGSAQQVPGASDSQIIAGSGSDASPGFAYCLPDPGFIGQVMADSAGGWWLRGYPNGANGPCSCVWQQDKVTPQITADDDPYVYWIATGGPPQLSLYNYGALCYFAHGQAGEQWVQVAAVRRTMPGGGQFACGANPLSGKDTPIAWEWARQGVAIKGYSVHHAINPHTGLTTPLVGQQTAAMDVITFDDTISPWDGATTPALVVP